jgi:hypothetical protein
MKIAKLDKYRDVTSTGYVIQRKTGRGNSKPVGAVYEPMVDSHGYRVTSLNGNKKKLHRVLWEAFNGPIPDGMHIDHINGNKLDNRIENLRLACHAENLWAHRSPTKGASSKYRGVSWHEKSKKWRALIVHKGKMIYIGLFASEVAAALARDAKAIELGWPIEGTNFFAANI